jgi:hypothetical protein
MSLVTTVASTCYMLPQILILRGVGLSEVQHPEHPQLDSLTRRISGTMAPGVSSCVIKPHYSYLRYKKAAIRPSRSYYSTKTLVTATLRAARLHSVNMASHLVAINGQFWIRNRRIEKRDRRSWNKKESSGRNREHLLCPNVRKAEASI